LRGLNLLGARAVLARYARCAPPMPPDPAPRAAKPRPASTLAPSTSNGAGDGNRTRDPELGRLALYHLSYSRRSSFVSSPEEWRGEDSNLRRQSPADLQSAPFGHSGTSPQRIPNKAPGWSRWSESNRRPADYKSAALPLSYIGGPRHPSGASQRSRPFPRNLLGRVPGRAAGPGRGGEHAPARGWP